MAVPGLGAAGQARLAACRALVVGAGGLGGPVLQILAGAGIGRITIMDPDRVELSNLHRQPLYRMTDLGRPKAEAARDAVLAANPALGVHAMVERFDPGSAALVGAADIVVDAADTLAATYVLSDACFAAGVPLVTAAVLEQRGHVGAFCGGAPSYRAVFPDMPTTAGSCAQNGVLGSTTAMLGSLQAHMALQVALGNAPSPLGRLVSVDLRTLAFGGFGFADAPEPAMPIRFILPADIAPADLVVDLRDSAEAPLRPDARRASPDEMDWAAAVPASQRIVLCCRSGVSAYRAARVLQGRQGRDVAVVFPGGW